MIGLKGGPGLTACGATSACRFRAGSRSAFGAIDCFPTGCACSLALVQLASALALTTMAAEAWVTWQHAVAAKWCGTTQQALAVEALKCPRLAQILGKATPGHAFELEAHVVRALGLQLLQAAAKG